MVRGRYELTSGWFISAHLFPRCGRMAPDRSDPDMTPYVGGKGSLGFGQT